MVSITVAGLLRELSYIIQMAKFELCTFILFTYLEQNEFCMTLFIYLFPGLIF